MAPQLREGNTEVVQGEGEIRAIAIRIDPSQLTVIRKVRIQHRAQF